MADTSQSLLCFVIAGEASGERIGADLITALRHHCNDRIAFHGIGGEAMQEAGLGESLFDMQELAVMGLSEVVPRLWHIKRRIDETVRAIQAYQPDILITIDAPDFGLRVQKRVNRVIDTKTRPYQVHYVAPTVWAWRAGRARTIASYLDQILCLYPFEPPYFERNGLRASFVGHPVMESADITAAPGAFRHKHAISTDTRLICLLPGSRRGELKRTAPSICAAAKRYAEDAQDDYAFLVPTLPHLREDVAGLVRDIPAPVYIINAQEDKWPAFKACDAAMAVSGTVALELAVAGVPHCIAYRTNSVTYWLLKAMVKLDYAHMLNIMADKEIVPEFLQSRAKPEALQHCLELLMTDLDMRQRQFDAYQVFRQKLMPENGFPGQAAAYAILKAYERR
jgi:lipid-A-disaccharide synthase